MEPGTIVKIENSDLRGVTLTTDKSLVQVLHYDFTTSWECIEDLEVLGHSDAIYKCMYEMMKG